MALYLGIDASTQGIKSELVDTELGTTSGCAVHFGRDLPQYGSPDGFLPNPDPLVRESDPAMWLDALDLLFVRLKESGAPLTKVAGISGSGQQHGTVYLNAKFAPALRSLDPGKSLAEQLTPCFSRPRSPIWMDRSTRAECAELDARFGARIRQLTGSPAIERFSGPQIRKFAREQPEAYGKTAVIHLVSSFFASVLCGASAGIDHGDGAGMNLLNLNTLQWDREIVEFTAPGLLAKLPSAVPSASKAGTLSPYFEKYGFAPGTPVAVWSGDNPNSLIGLGVSGPGCAGLSLGTSDTFFGAMRTFHTDPDGFGHVFGNPAGGFMSLICFTNGSLAREKVRSELGLSYDEFDAEVEANGTELVMLPYFEAESTPAVLKPGVVYGFDPETASKTELVRALLESQILSMRLHSGWLGEEFTRIRVTGGASKSAALRRIIADVFQARVETIAVGNSAGLGAALRAANLFGGNSFDSLYARFSTATSVIEPNPATGARYDRMRNNYRSLEAKTVSSSLEMENL